jgi:hypothetical protein
MLFLSITVYRVYDTQHILPFTLIKVDVASCSQVSIINVCPRVRPTHHRCKLQMIKTDSDEDLNCLADCNFQLIATTA